MLKWIAERLQMGYWKHVNHLFTSKEILHY
jgi:hypothetical protein